MFQFTDSRFTHMPFAAVRPDGGAEEVCCIPDSGNSIISLEKNGNESGPDFRKMQRNVLLVLILKMEFGKSHLLPEAGREIGASAFTGCMGFMGK